MKKHIEVVAAILIHDGFYLAVQRGPAKLDYISYKWEFPGGKVEPNETLDTAIKRELKEELELTIEYAELFKTVKHEYPDFIITMHCFLCEVTTDQVQLTEHVDQRWLSHSELMDVDWAAADIPVAQALMKRGL